MISISIPIYNEEENIPLAYDEVRKVMTAIGQEWELIFVNDGSTDRSAKALDELAARDPAVKVVHFKRNFGQTAAMMAGFEFAKGDIVIPMDGDLQNDPADIPKLLEKLNQGFDVCSGWRKDRQDNPIKRNFPSRVANRLISCLSGVSLHDYGCSLKAYRRDVIDGVKLYGEMHRFIPIYASWQGAKVTEVAVSHRPRRFGESKYGLERVVKVVLDLIVVKFLKKYAQKPMYIFGGLGLITLFMSFISAVTAIYFKFWGGKPFVETPLPLLTLTLGVLGGMCFLMGLLAELSVRTYYESQGKSTYVVGSTKNVT